MKSEFEFINSMRRKSYKDFAKIGIGDDCAVLPKDSKNDLVITGDLIVEDIDFKLQWSKPEFIGHKSLAVSLSDIAAMGAKPLWSMTSIGVPEKIWKTDFVEKFYEGYLKLAKKFGVQLIGGDVSKTPDKIVIDSIAAGEVKRGKAVLRSGAKVGDLIFVTGKLGGAALALEMLKNGERYQNSNHKKFLERQLKPNPQIEIGQILGKENLATAMIDLSDGLSSDLVHLCQESKVGAKIYAEKFLLDKINVEEFELKTKNQKSKIKDQIPFLDFALNGGEDFELLFTVNPKKNFRLEKALKNHKILCIGEATANVGMIELISGQKSQSLKPKGFRHF